MKPKLPLSAEKKVLSGWGIYWPWQWSYFGPIEIVWKSEYLLNIWIFVDVHSYLRLFICLASKSQLWTKGLPKMMFSWKSQLILFSISNLHYNVCNFYFLIWLRCFQLMFSSLTIYWINTNFHFSFLFRLRFLSIDFFLNLQIHLRPTYYFSLFLSSLGEIVINLYFSQSLNTDILCNYIKRSRLIF